MKKIFINILSIMLAFAVLVGCTEDNQQQTGENQNETENQELVNITISQNNGEEVIADKEIEIEDGAILMDVLKENFDIEETDGYITSIEGLAVDEEAGKYWMYEVNGEMAPVGANEFELSAEDEIVFDLHAVE